MANLTFERVLEVVIEEFRLDGHEIVEQEGVHYARVVLMGGEGEGLTVVTDTNLTRMADAIVRRAA